MKKSEIISPIILQGCIANISEPCANWKRFIFYRELKEYEEKFKQAVKDENKIPRNFMMPDTRKIDAAIKANIQIPGIEVSEKTILAVK